MTALDTLHNNSDHRVNHLNNDNLMVQRKRRMTMEVKRRRRRSL
jgi:hypothetical protein